MGVFNNFPYANFHELNADWIIEQVRTVKDEWEEYENNMNLWKLGVDEQLQEFQTWFDNLDVQDEVRTVINELIQNGEFIEIAGPQIVSATEAWLTEHITPTTPAIDDTLSISGAAADAKVTGDRITDLKEDLYEHIEHEDTPVDITEISGKVIDRNTRELVDTTTTYAVSNIIPVQPHEKYLITASMNYAYYLYVFYDSSNNPFGGEQSETGSTITTITDKEVVIPTGAVGLRIGYATSASFQHGVKKRANLLVADAITDELLNILDEPIDEINQKLNDLGITTLLGVNILNPATMLRGWALNNANGEIFENASYISSDFIEVEVGKKYSAFAVNNGNIIGLAVARVCAYNSDKTFNSYLGNISYSSTIPNTVTIPATVKYVRISFTTANYDGFGVPMFSETDGAAMPNEIVAYKESTGLAEVKQWIGKKWTAVGDSLTERNDKTTINYCDYISEITGISVVNMGESGTGYMRKHSTNHAFYDRVVNVPTDSDVVTIFGSLNDLGDGQQLGTIDDDVSDNTVFGYVNGTLDALYTAYPAVNIGIISPTPWKSSEPWDTNNNSTKYCEGLKQICYNRGIAFLDLYHCSNLRPWDATARDLFYSKDIVDGVNAGCHPDEDGHKMFAPKVKNFLDSLIV